MTGFSINTPHPTLRRPPSGASTSLHPLSSLLPTLIHQLLNKKAYFNICWGSFKAFLHHVIFLVVIIWRYSTVTQEAPWRYIKVTQKSSFGGRGQKNQKLGMKLTLCVFLLPLQKYRNGKIKKGNGLNFEDNFVFAITLKLQMFQFRFHCSCSLHRHQYQPYVWDGKDMP